MNNGKYWLCWSPRQNAFHIESEADGLTRNRRSFTDDRKPDFMPIGLFLGPVEANAEADRLTPILRLRDKKRGFPPPLP
jgi:hypothetical protein